VICPTWGRELGKVRKYTGVQIQNIQFSTRLIRDTVSAAMSVVCLGDGLVITVNASSLRLNNKGPVDIRGVGMLSIKMRHGPRMKSIYCESAVQVAKQICYVQHSRL